MRPSSAAVLAVALAGCETRPPRSIAAACVVLPARALEWQSADTIGPHVGSMCVPPELGIFARELEERGIVVGETSCDLALTVSFAASPDVPVDWSAHPDGFAWAVTGTTVEIAARTLRGAHYAAHAIVSSIAALPTRAADWPRFATRGVIEGFYNRYSTVQERAFTLSLMHQLAENTYLYSPKGDPYVGLEWRELYAGQAAADIRAAAGLADTLDIDFVFGIAPTLATTNGDPTTSIRFSSEVDHGALRDKLAGMHALGVSRFSIQFDDAAGELYWPEDRAKYATLAGAHAALANRLVAELDAPLLFVGTAYNSASPAWHAYNIELGQRLDPRIQVMWTGPVTFSPTIGPDDLVDIDLALGRQVVLWDNWPEAAMPVTGRDPLLYTGTQALLTNATLVGDFGNPVHDFWKVLGPLADYAWAPEHYDADVDYAGWQPRLAQLEGCH